MGQPQGVAGVVTFLLSEQASWVTGVVWDLDGGVMGGRNGRRRKKATPRVAFFMRRPFQAW